MANFATLNPLGITNSNQSLSEGNLTHTVSGQWLMAVSTLAMTSGKYYFEMTVIDTTSFLVGVCQTSADSSAIYYANTANFGYPGKYAGSVGWAGSASLIVGPDQGSSLGTTTSNGDIVMIAFDADTNKLWYGKNGSWFASGDPANGSNPATTVDGGTPRAGGYYFALGNENATNRCNFGQFPFRYDPPSGFVALSTENLAEPPISNLAADYPEKYFGVMAYDGQGGSRDVTDTDAVQFTPDLVWIKHRQDAANHTLFDSVRGAGKYLAPNSTATEATEAQSLTAFIDGGFSVGTEPNSPRTDESGGTSAHVAWCWKAGGTAVSNTDGSITSQVSANTDAGFSIVRFTGTGSVGTVGHGLGAVPKFIITKKLDTTTGWRTYHASMGNAKSISLDVADGQYDSANWNSTTPTSSVIHLGTGDANGNGADTMAYCWAEVEGFSSFGQYTGNGSASGPFIYTGFRPAFVLVKNKGSSTYWTLFDNQRPGYNLYNYTLNPDRNAAEVTNGGNGEADLLSNGFRLVDADSGVNGNGANYIYMAFAESPFKYSSAR